MWKLDHCELSNTKHDANHCRVSLAGPQQNECRNHDVPHCWKSVEPDVFSLLIGSCEPKSTCYQDESRDCHGQAGLNYVHANQQNSWHYDAGDVIDDQV